MSWLHSICASLLFSTDLALPLGCRWQHLRLGWTPDRLEGVVRAPLPLCSHNGFRGADACHPACFMLLRNTGQVSRHNRILCSSHDTIWGIPNSAWRRSAADGSVIRSTFRCSGVASFEILKGFMASGRCTAPLLATHGGAALDSGAGRVAVLLGCWAEALAVCPDIPSNPTPAAALLRG
jgi:hypothetical protein